MNKGMYKCSKCMLPVLVSDTLGVIRVCKCKKTITKSYLFGFIKITKETDIPATIICDMEADAYGKGKVQ